MSDPTKTTYTGLTDPPEPTGLDEADALARIEILTPISIIVPTYQERDSIPHLIERLNRLRTRFELTIEVLIMDDSSGDGSKEWVEQSRLDWVELIERDGPRGLSAAVLDGINRARHPVIVVMDADLSHPPEKIPDMILALQAGQEIVVGSRYVTGGSTDDQWGFVRWLNSFIATLLARPLTSVSDPMAGFFALHKKTLERAPKFNPIGYKIALEIIVKCHANNVGEIPIHFSDRVYGKSKLNLQEQLKYIKHLRRLYIFKFGTWSHLAQFLVVGLSGVFVNLSVLYALVWMKVPEKVAYAIGIAVSLTTNFLLNRRFSFSYARDQSIFKQYTGFAGACSVGMLVNFAVFWLLTELTPDVPLWIDSLAGIASGTTFNFLISRYLVFRSGKQVMTP